MSAVVRGDVSTGELAKLEIHCGATAIADRVKSTMGPHGRDKMLVSRPRELQVSVTNDGATILKSMQLDNPAAKLLVEISKTQDSEVGDGTTSVCVLAGEILRGAETLINEKVHPQTIVAGIREAQLVAQSALAASSRTNDLRDDLLNIAKTTLNSKILAMHMEVFAPLAVDAVMRIRSNQSGLEAIHIIKKLGGSVKDSFLESGFLLDKKIGVGQPKRMENAKILVANTGMDTDKIKMYGARVRVDSIAKLAELENAERQKMEGKCKKIISHGVNCFINRQLIYNFPEEIFAEAGVMAIEHADFEGVERLAAVLGAEVTSTFDNPETVKLGECKLIDEVMVGEDVLIRFTGCKGGEACTIVLRGPSQNILDEAERSLHDALCVLSETVKDHRTVFGAGCSEMLMAKAVEEAAKEVQGKKALAMKGYAKALRSIPAIIATNAGLDAQDLVARLESAHAHGKSTMGLDIENNCIADIAELKITESFKCKSSVVNYATEAAEMLLRCNQIVRCAPRQRR